jgi:hypothetical protein
MRNLQRITWSAHLLAPALLFIPACFDPTSDLGYDGNCVEGTPARPRCTDWNSYSDDWHRCHWNEPGIVWCSAPTGSPGTGTSNDAGSGYLATSDAGSSVSSDSGGLTMSETSDAGSSVKYDSGVAVLDGSGTGATGPADGSAGSGDAAGGGQSTSCTVGQTCPVGDSCVTGSCEPCAHGVCECLRDDDCAGSQICDHTSATCTVPPPPCTALTTEADCVARADCTPIYGGMSCTNTAGDPCHSGEANCTCATYSFAACVGRTP